jgi:hypothetical protein
MKPPAVLHANHDERLFKSSKILLQYHLTDARLM